MVRCAKQAFSFEWELQFRSTTKTKQLEEVFITANRSETKRSETPVAISKLNAKAKGALRRAKLGQSVQIFDIKVKNPNNPSYRFKKVSPVICEIAN